MDDPAHLRTHARLAVGDDGSGHGWQQSEPLPHRRAYSRQGSTAVPLLILGLLLSEVLRRLQDDPATRLISVAVLSADATERQKERLTTAGARAYLTKPPDIREFRHTIDVVLECEACYRRADKDLESTTVVTAGQSTVGVQNIT